MARERDYKHTHNIWTLETERETNEDTVWWHWRKWKWIMVKKFNKLIDVAIFTTFLIQNWFQDIILKRCQIEKNLNYNNV